MSLIRYEAWLMEMIKMTNPGLIVFEMPHNRGGAATALLNFMAEVIKKVCAEKKIEHTSVHSSTLKKHATGSGKSKKDAMMAAAKKKFKIEILDDNHADALWILHWAYKEYVKK